MSSLAVNTITDEAGTGSPSFPNGLAGGIPAGTVMLFVQTTAPVGFTKSTANDNKALRVVSGTASTGGTVAFTTAFASGLSAGSTTLATTQIPAHNHTFIGPSTGPTVAFNNTSGLPVNQGTRSTNNTGGGGSHNHTIPSFAVQYVDTIIAAKD